MKNLCDRKLYIHVLYVVFTLCLQLNHTYSDSLKMFAFPLLWPIMLLSILYMCLVEIPVFSCDSIDKLRKRCETLHKDIQDPYKFKLFYQFTFSFAKTPGQKALGMYDS